MNRIVSIFVVFCAIAMLTGCVMKRGDLSIAGVKKIDPSMQGFEKIADNITGRSVQRIIIIFGIDRQPTISNAVKDALEKVNGDIMTDVQIHYKWWAIPLIYGEGYFEVKGSVWKLKKDR